MSQPPKRLKNLHSFFKPKNTSQETDQHPSEEVDEQNPTQEGQHRPTEVIGQPPSRVIIRLELVDFDYTSFERDPGLRLPIDHYHINQRDEVRRAYIKAGPYQINLNEYPASQSSGDQNRRFQASWFKKFHWLEYSPSKDKVFCFPCFLFESHPPKYPTFTVDGFNKWKRVNDGQRCAFLQHVGGPHSPHSRAIVDQDNLARPSLHINNRIDSQSKQVAKKNRLRLEASIQAVRWLAYQACAFRGHDESLMSLNRGNFIQLIMFTAYWNKEVKAVVLENAPKNSIYTSPQIQKELLHILANTVKRRIREHIGNQKFCILVDEATDEAHEEQMAIILRFVDSGGFIRERFFAVVGVPNTASLTMKTEIDNVLAHYNLDVTNMRGQGYDGASNMRGAWNGLQALFLNDCPYAYSVHCFAHRLQLALVAVCEDDPDFWLFFSMMGTVTNLIKTSPKRQAEFHSAQVSNIAMRLEAGELETGRGANQIRNLQRAGDTRWSSHFRSANRLIHMFDETYTVLESIRMNGTPKLKGQAKGACKAIKKFKFVFILHLVHSIMGITDILCQSLQQKSQDIVNAMNLVSSTRKNLQELRQNGWSVFLEEVKTFAEKHKIKVPDLHVPYLKGTGRSCQQRDNITKEHHYHFDIFNEALDRQEMALEARFQEKTMRLLILSSALDPRDSYKAFKIDDICDLAEEFYPADFTEQERVILKSQLQHYIVDIPQHRDFQNLNTIAELCQILVATRKSLIYYLIDRLIRLVLTLPVSTATTERAFSAMKLIKTQLRNKMEDEFLSDCMTLYIEKDISDDITAASIIDEFASLKDRKVQFH